MKQMTAAIDAAKEGSKRTVALFAVLTAAMALVMASALPAAAQDTTVEGLETTWSPDSITIEAGSTVTFDMVAGGVHNGIIQETGEDILGGTVNEGDSASYTFDEAGSFTVECTIHAGMLLDVTVTEGDGGNGDDPADEDPADEDPADEDPADEDPADEDTADEDPADENGEDPADEDTEGDDVEAPTSVDSGTGGLVSNGMPLWLGALMALGVLALAAPAVASRRR